MMRHGIWFVVMAACGPSDPPEEPFRPYALDDVLRINHLQAKGTHNSYHLRPDGLDLTDWDYEHAPLDVQLDTQGVRQFEFDIHDDRDATDVTVYHLWLVDDKTTCETVTECAATLNRWSIENPRHHPIVVMLEPRVVFDANTVEDFFARLETQIIAGWPKERIITPDKVRGTHASLGEALATEGWPLLRDARGKAIFWFHSTGDFRRIYTHEHTSLANRLMFIDSSTAAPYRAVAPINEPTRSAAIRAALDANMLVRTRADITHGVQAETEVERRDLAFASGANFVSTDHPIKRAGINYVVDIPDGSPSRCNPVTAPSICENLEIEDPQRLR